MRDGPLRVTMIGRRVAPAHGPGGLETVVREQALEIAGCGIEVDLWTELPRDSERRARAEAAFADRVRLHWVAPGPLPLGRMRGTVILDRITNYPWWSHRVARAIGDPGDIVHVQGLAGLGAAARRRAGDWRVPMVLTTQGMEEFLVAGLKRALYAPFRAGMRGIAAASDRVIVTDRALVPVVGALLDLNPDQAVVIPNAIYPDTGPAVADCEAARRLLAGAGHADREFKLVSMGRFEANKGFELLAAALGRVKDTLGDWVWVLIGDGPRREMIEAALAAAGIQDRCLLVGRVAEPLKHGLLASADWFVHPTLFDGPRAAGAGNPRRRAAGQGRNRRFRIPRRARQRRGTVGGTERLPRCSRSRVWRAWARAGRGTVQLERRATRIREALQRAGPHEVARPRGQLSGRRDAAVPCGRISLAAMLPSRRAPRDQTGTRTTSCLPYDRSPHSRSWRR